MKNVKIVLVAEWDGWCGACTAERPLVLTRTGRLGLRAWLAAAAVDGRPLTLTCRLCGTGVVIPPEQDDPPVLLEDEHPVPALLSGTPTSPPMVPVSAAPTLQAPTAPVLHRTPELDAARSAVGAALGALLAERAAVAVPAPAPSVTPLEPAPAAVVPLQRSATADADGLAALHLLADGIDLLSAGRA